MERWKNRGIRRRTGLRLGTNRFNSLYSTQLAVFSACSRPFLYLETGFADSADINFLAGDENNKATAQVIADSIIEWYDKN